MEEQVLKTLTANWESLSPDMKKQHAEYLLKHPEEIIHTIGLLNVFKRNNHFEVLEDFDITFYLTEEKAVDYCLDKL
jgi:hypothetical protein